MTITPLSTVDAATNIGGATLLLDHDTVKGSDPLLSHLRVIPAEAGIQWLWVHILINDLLDIRFCGYDMISVLEFHVHLQFNTMWQL